MSVIPPEANGWSATLKRETGIVVDFGSVSRVPHIRLSSKKQFEKTWLVGSRLLMTYYDVE